jgi:hypothetical protein
VEWKYSEFVLVNLDPSLPLVMFIKSNAVGVDVIPLSFITFHSLPRLRCGISTSKHNIPIVDMWQNERQVFPHVNYENIVFTGVDPHRRGG